MNGRIWLVIFVVSALVFLVSLGSTSRAPTPAPEHVVPHLNHKGPPVKQQTESGSGELSATTIISFMTALASLIASLTAWRRETREEKRTSGRKR